MSDPIQADGLEVVAWEGYWPGAGSISSTTKLTKDKNTAARWQDDGAEIEPLVTLSQAQSALAAMKGSHDELLKLSADLGEPDDPFAAWEALASLKARIKALEGALRAVSDTSHMTRDRKHYRLPLAVMERVDAVLSESKGEQK